MGSMRRDTGLPQTSRSTRRSCWRPSCLPGTWIRTPAWSTSRRRSSRSFVALRPRLHNRHAVSSAARGWRLHIRRDPTEKERWCTATRKIQEFVNKYGLTRKDEEPRVCRMNDGEDEEEESVGRSHARVFITRCRCRSSRPLPRLPQKQVERKHLLLVAKGTWTRIGSKSRRRFRGVERADSENVTNGKMRTC